MDDETERRSQERRRCWACKWSMERGGRVVEELGLVIGVRKGLRRERVARSRERKLGVREGREVTRERFEEDGDREETNPMVAAGREVFLSMSVQAKRSGRSGMGQGKESG